MHSSLKDALDRKILHTGFFKVQYTIIQAILSRKSMKKFAVPHEKYSVSIRLLTFEINSHTDLRTSHVSFWSRAVSIERKTTKIKFCHKRSTLPVKKSRQLK